MELKEFIVNTIDQIAEGVQCAIEHSDGRNYLVNPSTVNDGATYTIHFDLAVESGKDGSAGIKILNGSITEKSVNHISFDVNMSYPTSGNTKRSNRPVYE